MAPTIQQAQNHEIEQLVPLLLLAEPAEGALRWGLANLVDAVYRMDNGAALVGAATMRWRAEPCEINELAITPERQGQGLGRVFVGWLADEARRRGQRAMLVGTPNSSIGNIAFYQRVGFRMHEVRRDYFGYYARYYGGPKFENGIETRDMLVFRMELR
jgi:GNAT superfamily N-acetyltransferase